MSNVIYLSNHTVSVDQVKITRLECLLLQIQELCNLPSASNNILGLINKFAREENICDLSTTNLPFDGPNEFGNLE